VSNPDSGNAWKSYVDGILARSSNLERTGSYYVDKRYEDLTRHAIQPKNKIKGSSEWLTCTGAGSACGDHCCCSEGQWYNGKDCVGIGSRCGSVAMMYTVKTQEQLDAAIEQLVESQTGTELDVYSSAKIEDLDAADWEGLIESLGDSCPAGSQFNMITLEGASSDGNKKVKSCITTVAVTEKWGDYEDGEEPVLASKCSLQRPGRSMWLAGFLTFALWKIRA